MKKLILLFVVLFIGCSDYTGIELYHIYDIETISLYDDFATATKKIQERYGSILISTIPEYSTNIANSSISFSIYTYGTSLKYIRKTYDSSFYYLGAVDMYHNKFGNPHIIETNYNMWVNGFQKLKISYGFNYTKIELSNKNLY